MMTSEARKRQPPTQQQLLAARSTITKVAGIVGLHIEDDNDELLLQVAGDVGTVLAEAVEIVRRFQDAPRPAEATP